MACVTAGVMLGAVGLVHSMEQVMQTKVVTWGDAKVEKTGSGTVRQYFRAPTSTLLKLGLRARTLAPGESPHPERPNARSGEELLLVKNGTLEIKLGEETQTLSAGSAVFLSANQKHVIQNTSDTEVTYYVVDWVSPGMNGKRQDIGL